MSETFARYVVIVPQPQGDELTQSFATRIGAELVMRDWQAYGVPARLIEVTGTV